MSGKLPGEYLDLTGSKASFQRTNDTFAQAGTITGFWPRLLDTAYWGWLSSTDGIGKIMVWDDFGAFLTTLSGGA